MQSFWLLLLYVAETFVVSSYGGRSMFWLFRISIRCFWWVRCGVASDQKDSFTACDRCQHIMCILHKIVLIIWLVHAFYGGGFLQSGRLVGILVVCLAYSVAFPKKCELFFPFRKIKSCLWFMGCTSSTSCRLVHWNKRQKSQNIRIASQKINYQLHQKQSETVAAAKRTSARAEDAHEPNNTKLSTH